MTLQKGLSKAGGGTVEEVIKKVEEKGAVGADGALERLVMVGNIVANYSESILSI